MTEIWSVRCYDAAGRRVRQRCRSREHADFERARIAMEAAAFAPAPPGDEPDGTTQLAEFWPVWIADARRSSWPRASGPRRSARR